MFKHKIYLGLYLSIFCTFSFIFDILLHIYLISFSFFPHFDLHHVGKRPIFELGQWRSSLLSPSQLVAADFCSGSCLLAQTDTLLFFSLPSSTLCPNLWFWRSGVWNLKAGK